MMNKKGFAVTPREMIIIFIAIIFGIGFWFIESSVKDIFNLNGFTPYQTLGIGIAILLAVLFIVKFKIYYMVLG